MPLQLEKADVIPKGQLVIKAYKNALRGQEGSTYAKVQPLTDTITMSNLTALIAERNPGIEPALVHLVARIANKEIKQQVALGKKVEIMGIGTAYLGLSKGIKKLNPSIEDIPPVALKFKTSRLMKSYLKGITVKSVYLEEYKPEIKEVIDLDRKTKFDIKKGNIVQLKGKNLKVEGNLTEVGLFIIVESGGFFKISPNELLRNENGCIEFIMDKGNSSTNIKILIKKQRKYKTKYSTNLVEGETKDIIKLMV